MGDDHSLRPRVLIVDDDKVSREYLSKVELSDFEVRVDNGANGIKHVFDLVDTFAPHILITDVWLPGFTGIDVLERLRKRHEFLKIVISGKSDSEVAEKANTLGADLCLSKGFKHGLLAGKLGELLPVLARRKKQACLETLLARAGCGEFRLKWQDANDVEPGKTGSHVLYTDVSEEWKNVRAIGLFLTHTRQSHGSCLSVAFGCKKNCPICSSGTEEVFRGQYGAAQIVAMQELVMRESVFYNDAFWLFDLPFFTAYMGSGDIAFNFENFISSAEILQSVFGSRFTCNVSTAFIKGVELLIKYLEKSGKVVPNLQISLHGPNRLIRRLHVDSDEDLGELIRFGHDYVRLASSASGDHRVLTNNYGLTTDNCHRGMINSVLSRLNPECDRIKFSLMNLPKNSKLVAAPKEMFAIAAMLAAKKGITCEIFDENKQAGIDSGGHCGGMRNEILETSELTEERWRY